MKGPNSFFRDENHMRLYFNKNQDLNKFIPVMQSLLEPLWLDLVHFVAKIWLDFFAYGLKVARYRKNIAVSIKAKITV